MCTHDQDIKSNLEVKKGSEMAHGIAHEKAHNKWSRRSFLRGLGISGGMGMMLGHLPVNALSSSPLNMLLDGGNTDRVLVMIRLKGGNDGLNTLIPLYDFDTYRNNRPQISKQVGDTIQLTNEHAINQNLERLMPLWNNGQMKIVNGVGYENHNLSHFRSSDIIASASDAEQIEDSGWLGRHLNDCFPDFLTNAPEHPSAVQIAGGGSILFGGGEGGVNNYALTVSSPDQLFEIAQTGQLYNLDGLPECTYGEQLGFLRTVANTTFQYAEVIKERFDEGVNGVNYTTSLGQQLALVARLIKGGLRTQFYVVTLNGFDTHANQESDHDNLMNTLGTAVSNFYADLKLEGKDESVLAMTFSEFGRRVQENASRGTGHGTASPTMLFGPSLNGNGIIGDNPDLNDLDSNGNLKFTTDFRSIYATVLEQWLCLDAQQVDAILFRNFARLELGLRCQTVSASPWVDIPKIKHEVRYHDHGRAFIYYELERTQYIKVVIISISGKHLKTLQNGSQPGGQYALDVNLDRQFVMAPLIYRISINDQSYSKTLPLLKI